MFHIYGEGIESKRHDKTALNRIIHPGMDFRRRS